MAQGLAASQAVELAEINDRGGAQIWVLPGPEREDLRREVLVSDDLAKYLVHAVILRIICSDDNILMIHLF